MNADLSEPASSSRNSREEAEGELRALLARWQRPLFGFAWRYLHNAADAEEVTIETFARYCEHRGRLRAGAQVSSWLFATAANLCRNRHRWRRRHPQEPDEPSGDLPCPDPSPDDAARLGELRAEVRAAIDALPPDQKTALLLHEYEQASCREIAAVVGCSERGVETRLYRAKRQLRRRLRHLLPEV
ncbi:MAG TPA: sigma-70 family RNA polymerase sigma factor [Opitutaceae bacterium]|nr:sigma-70 family RNA polymerase sigma factor [Opitutaceae bacterium]